jgi:sulfatase maturation enzyme AslB (radical SAM superfamily)
MIRSISPDVVNLLDIEWVVNNYCNFKCSYCNPDLYGNTSRALDIDVAVNFFNNIHNNYPQQKMLTLSGGEPTLWKHLPEFVDSVAENYYFQIITNGSRTLDWWQRFMYNRTIDRITISVHSEFVDWDKTYSVIEYLSSVTDVTVLMLFKPGTLSVIQNFVNRMIEESLAVSIKIKPLTSHDNRSVYEYTEQEHEYTNNFYYNHSIKNKEIPIARYAVIDGKICKQDRFLEMIYNKENSFTGWECDLGRTRLFIWHDGNVYPATCKTAMGRPIGNVFNGTIESYISPTICKDQFCHCLPDIRIPKRIRS